MKEVAILTDFAKNMIKQKNYTKAMKAVTKALSFLPDSNELYNILGNIYYLLGQKDHAYRAYLSSIHLQINKLMNSEASAISAVIDSKYNDLPDNEKRLLPSKYAVVLLNDNIVSSHIAHAFIDLSGNYTDSLVSECSDLYKEALYSFVSPKELTNYYNICYDDYIEFEKSHYISLGRDLLMHNINWNRLDSDKVIDLYF